jgi:hypothetical protein
VIDKVSLRHAQYVLRVVLVIALCSPGLSNEGFASPDAITESEVKAAYLYNFAKFIAWPERSFATADAPMEICVLDDTSFGSTLREIVYSHTVDGHPVQVVNVTAVAGAHDCHILFIPSLQAKQVRALIEAIGYKSIVTVGETQGFLEEGGIIQFALQEGKVKFQVNLHAAARSGVRISARLLGIATRVIQ